ncbi:hypothetical protein AKJ16_DCAP00859 [Drosera capensis]
MLYLSQTAFAQQMAITTTPTKMPFLSKIPTSILSSSPPPFPSTYPFHPIPLFTHKLQSHSIQIRRANRGNGLVCGVLPVVDPWSPTIDSQSIAPQLFALSLFPYLGFLYFITKSKSAPKLTLFGFYFLLAFVGATIPAGIYAKVHYGTSLSNVDWLHGGAESLLTLSNLFVVLGLRKALREPRDSEKSHLINEEKPTT